MKWEYLRVVQQKKSDDPRKPPWDWEPEMDILARYGLEGWECFHVAILGEYHFRKKFYFKRPITESE